MRLRLFYGRHLRLQLGEKIIQIGSSKAENGQFKELTAKLFVNIGQIRPNVKSRLKYVNKKSIKTHLFTYVQDISIHVKVDRGSAHRRLPCQKSTKRPTALKKKRLNHPGPKLPMLVMTSGKFQILF